MIHHHQHVQTRIFRALLIVIIVVVVVVLKNLMIIVLGSFFPSSCKVVVLLLLRLRMCRGQGGVLFVGHYGCQYTQLIMRFHSLSEGRCRNFCRRLCRGLLTGIASSPLIWQGLLKQVVMGWIQQRLGQGYRNAMLWLRQWLQLLLKDGFGRERMSQWERPLDIVHGAVCLLTLWLELLPTFIHVIQHGGKRVPTKSFVHSSLLVHKRGRVFVAFVLGAEYHGQGRSFFHRHHHAVRSHYVGNCGADRCGEYCSKS